jgi:hypothetical protein
MTLYVDGKEEDVQPTPSNMHQPMYMIANLAVGGAGSWPGAPNSSTVFPANFDISYVRAYQLPGYPAPLLPTPLTPADGSATNPKLTLELFNSNVTNVSSGGSAVLTWSSTGSCTASGAPDWTGIEGPFGSQTVSNIIKTTTYVLDCSDASGGNQNIRTITITVPTTSSTTTTTTTTASTTTNPPAVTTPVTTPPTTTATTTLTIPTLPTILPAKLSSSSVVAGGTVNITYNWNAVPMPGNYDIFVHFSTTPGYPVFQDVTNSGALPNGLTTETWSGPKLHAHNYDSCLNSAWRIQYFIGTLL